MDTYFSPTFGNNDPNNPLVTPPPSDPLEGHPGYDAEYMYLQQNDPKNVYSTEHLRQKFTSSDSYKKAKQLFENGPQSDVWLAKLQSIVDSLAMPGSNFWSDVGNAFANTYANRFQELLNNAFVSLNNLTNSWFEWFNKLPKEQREQFESAGLNIALDGGSQLTGSDFTPQQIAPSPDFQAQQNQAFDNAVSFATSTADGLLNLVGLVNSVFSLRQQKRSLDITENSTLYNINKERISLGLSPLSSLGSVRDSSILEKDQMSNYAIKSSNEAEAGSKKSRIALETDVNPLYDAVDDVTRLGIGPYNELMAELGNIQLGQRIYQMLYDKEKLSFDSKQLEINSRIQSEYGAALATGEAQTALQEQSAKQVEFRTSSKLKEFGEQLYDYKKKMLSDWIEKANSGEPDSFIYSSILMKSGIDLKEFMGPADAGLEYLNKGTDILDELLGIFNPVKWLKPLKKSRK